MPPHVLLTTRALSGTSSFQSRCTKVSLCPSKQKHSSTTMGHGGSATSSMAPTLVGSGRPGRALRTTSRPLPSPRAMPQSTESACGWCTCSAVGSQKARAPVSRLTPSSGASVRRKARASFTSHLRALAQSCHWVRFMRT